MSLPHKIGDLQLLRGVAIALVVATHLPLTHALAARLPAGVWHPGWLGVDLFFVVSGYVITRSLVRDRFEPLAFVVRRLFRLTPPLAVLVGLTVGLSLTAERWAGPGLPAAGWVPPREEVGWRAAAAVGGVYTLAKPATGGSLLGVVWSLAVEDQFYAAVAVACVVGALAGGRVAPRLLLALAGGVYLLLTVMRLQFLARGHISVTSSPLAVYLFFLRFDLLAAGVLVGLFDHRFGPRLAPRVARVGPYLAPLLVAAPLALATVTGSVVTLSRLTQGLLLVTAGGCFAGLVLVAAHQAAVPGWGRGRLYRWATALGDRSYSVYLFHGPAVLAGVALSGGESEGARLTQAAAAAVVLAATTELVYRGLEKPLTSRGRRVADRLRVRPPADQPPRNHRMSDQPGSNAGPLAVAVGSS